MLASLFELASSAIAGRIRTTLPPSPRPALPASLRVQPAQSGLEVGLEQASTRWEAASAPGARTRELPLHDGQRLARGRELVFGGLHGSLGTPHRELVAGRCGRPTCRQVSPACPEPGRPRRARRAPTPMPKPLGQREFLVEPPAHDRRLDVGIDRRRFQVAAIASR